MHTLVPAAPAPVPTGRLSPRRRESAEVRIRQILDAALSVFSARGFAGSRMDDVAAQCGLSKGALYCRFKSKDELFEALVCRHLQLSHPCAAELPLATALRPLVEGLVSPMYQRLTEPDTITVLRLLIAEGQRMPHLVTRWQIQVLDPYQQALRLSLMEAAAQFGGKPGVLADEPRLVLAPAVLMMLKQLISGEQDVADTERMRSAHIDMLCAWLTVKPSSTSATESDPPPFPSSAHA